MNHARGPLFVAIGQRARICVSAGVISFAALACGRSPTRHLVIEQSGQSASSVLKKKEKSPKLDESVMDLTVPSLRRYLYRPDGQGHGRPNWEEDSDAFDNGVANIIKVGGTPDSAEIAITPERGNFLIDLTITTNNWGNGSGKGTGGRAVAKLRNIDERSTADASGLRPGEVAYLFLERLGDKIVSYVVVEGDARKSAASDVWVCHDLKPGQPKPVTAAANIFSPEQCDPAVRKQALTYLLAPWIPCAQGCCMAGSGVMGRGGRARNE